MKSRCEWVTEDEIYIQYHDEEWGVPVYDEYKLFEHLILDSHQAGLSWLTILKKRENYRKAFDNFNPQLIAEYDDMKFNSLMNNKGIVRNRLKIESTIKNASAFLLIQKEDGSFSDFIWSFIGGKPRVNSWNSLQEIPSKTTESELMSKTLIKRGFKFVGPTICYAFMQATGMVNDHITSCYRHRELIRLCH